MEVRQRNPSRQRNKGQKGLELEKQKEKGDVTPEGNKQDMPGTSKKKTAGAGKDETPIVRKEIMLSERKEVPSTSGIEKLSKTGGGEGERESESEKRVYDAAYNYGDQTVKEVHERMIVTIANSACTSEEKQSLLGDIVTLIELYRKQQAHAQFIRGMLQERKKDKEYTSDTYAERVKQKLRSRSRSRSARRGDKGLHVVAVVPKEEQDYEITRKDIQKEISPTELKIGVNVFRKIGKGGALIGTEKSEELDRLVEEMNKTEKIVRKYKIEKPRKRLPQVIIYGVREELDKELIRERVVEQNEVLEGGEVQCIAKYKTKEGENIILSMNGGAFKEIMKEKKIKLGWQRYDIREYLRPKICYNCFRMGHIARVCKNEKVCRECGEKGHEGECSTGKHCGNCRFLNSKSNIKVDINHSPTDSTCSYYSAEVGRLINRTDYG